jgi:hypothetical protein
MHLVNILRIILHSFLVGHSILTISDFNSFRVFWDTLYRAFTRWAVYKYADYKIKLKQSDFERNAKNILGFEFEHF